MQLSLLIDNPENKRLVIFFAGWSTGPEVLAGMEIPEDYNLICCWDYRDLTMPEFHKTYDEIIVIAWSFGVAAADSLMKKLRELAKSISFYAVNGSPFPVDDERGIPEKIFNATYEYLSPAALDKFRIRICGGKSRYLSEKDRVGAKSDIKDLKSELEKFRSIEVLKPEESAWDFAFISENDKIFPKDNLIKAWENTPYMVLKDSHHFPEFQYLFNLIIKDKKRVEKKFKARHSGYISNALIQKKLSDRLINIIIADGLSRENILEVGGGEGYLNKRLNEVLNPKKYLMIDLYDGKTCKGKFLKGDAEVIIHDLPDAAYDLVISGSTMQWFHSPVSFMKEANRVLKDGGIFLFSTFTEGNLNEISELTDKRLLYLTPEDWLKAAEKIGFKVLNFEPQDYVMEFQNAFEILKHVKATGVNALTGKSKSIGEMRELINNYPHQNGTYKLTYKTLIMRLEKPKS